MKSISLFKEYSIYCQYVSVLSCSVKSEGKNNGLKPSECMSPAREDMSLDISTALFWSLSVKLFRYFKSLLTTYNIAIIKAFSGINKCVKMCKFCQLSYQLKNWVLNSPFCLFRLKRGKVLLSQGAVFPSPPVPPPCQRRLRFESAA